MQMITNHRCPRCNGTLTYANRVVSCLLCAYSTDVKLDSTGTKATPVATAV